MNIDSVAFSDVISNGFVTHKDNSIETIKKTAYYNLIFKRKIFMTDSNILNNRNLKEFFKDEELIFKDKVIVPIFRKSVKNFGELQSEFEKVENPYRPENYDYARWLDNRVKDSISGDLLGSKFTNTIDEVTQSETKNKKLQLGKKLSDVIERAKNSENENFLRASTIYTEAEKESPIISDKIKFFVDTIYFLTAAEAFGKQVRIGINADFIQKQEPILSLYGKNHWEYDYENIVEERDIFEFVTELKSPSFDPNYLLQIQNGWQFIRDNLRESDPGKQYFKAIDSNRTSLEEKNNVFVKYVLFCDKEIQKKSPINLREYKQSRRYFAFHSIIHGVTTVYGIIESFPYIKGENIAELKQIGKHLKFEIQHHKKNKQEDEKLEKESDDVYTKYKDSKIRPSETYSSP